MLIPASIHLFEESRSYFAYNVELVFASSAKATLLTDTAQRVSTNSRVISRLGEQGFVR
jgi:hypothetical protein